MSNVARVIEIMQQRFNPQAAVGLDLVFQFRLEDDDNYYVTVRDNQCQLTIGDAPLADVVFITDYETLKEVIKGELSGMHAYMSGRLRTEGNIMLAMQLKELFQSDED